MRRRPEGTISYDPSRKRWIARLWVEDATGASRRLQRSAESEKGATEALAKMIREHRVMGTAAASKRTLQTLYEFLDLHVWPGTLSPKTTSNYRLWYRLHLSPLGSYPVGKLTPATVQKRLAAIEAPTTANRVRSLLRAMLNASKRLWGEPATNPVQATTRRKQPPFDPRILTVDESRALLEAADGTPVYGPILVALACGLRRGEITGLTWDRVKLREGEIVVLAEKRSEYRTIPLAPSVSGYLSTLDRTGKWVFPAPEKPSARWDGRNMHRAYHIACRKAGIGSPRFHDLRATWASRMAASGVDVRTLMELGGWKEVATLMEIYARASRDTKRDAMRILAESLL